MNFATPIQFGEKEFKRSEEVLEYIARENAMRVEAERLARLEAFVREQVIHFAHNIIHRMACTIIKMHPLEERDSLAKQLDMVFGELKQKETDARWFFVQTNGGIP